jgi:3-hydroxyisobutyrate dehydrogenase
MKIGFIGLGAMGRGMAANLQSSGHELVVNDMRREAAQEYVERGAMWAATPRELAEQVTLVFTSLPTPADVEAVGLGDDGLAAGMPEGATWIDLSTNSVDVVRRMQATMKQHGVDFLDAPVSGGPGGAASGKLAIWVGGDRAVFERCEALLSEISDELRYIGDSGAGTVAKLVHNMASLAMNMVLVEAMTMGMKAGVEPLPLWEAIRSGGAGRQRAFDRLSARFMQGRLDPPSFQLRLAYKDAQLALQVGRDGGVPMRLCALTAAEMEEAINRGWGDCDSQSFLLLQQERALVPPFELAEEDVLRVLAEDSELVNKTG